MDQAQGLRDYVKEHGAYHESGVVSAGTWDAIKPESFADYRNKLSKSATGVYGHGFDVVEAVV